MTDPLREELQRSLGTAYTIERELGGGGMSRVFVAREARLRRDVVVKVLSPTLASELSAERFEREIALAARLQEPHIVPVLTAGETPDGVAYYTMPFVAGESLRARLRRGRVGPREAVSILRDVARALAYAHERGVVHRDIKPENVLLSSGTAVVTDFGIAKAISASRAAGPLHDGGSTLTGTGISIGTPAYMAPEQIGGETVDGRADVYAWGVLGYELLAGAHPFATRASSREVLVAQLAERPRALGELAPGVSPGVASLVMRALAKNPAERPSSAELLAGLDEANVSTGIGTRRSLAVAAGAAVIMLAGTGAFALLGWSRMVAREGAEVARSEVAPISSLVVMPFVNTGGDRADDYFSDGLSDELAHALVRLPGLRVAGRTSANAFRARNATAREIGRVLGVEAIVAGTVRRAGGRLRVTAELTSTADGHLLWSSEPFESRSADVFQVQDEFTRAVVTALAPTLRREPGTTMGISRRGTRDTAAYDLYLHGRYFWSRRGKENLHRAIDFFRRAAAADPSFARAHAALAMTYAVVPYFDPSLPPDSLMALAQESADHALAVDPAIADAHLALANVNMRDFRLDEARAHFLAALADAPLDPTANAWYGDYLARIGMIDSALAQKRRAVDLEPLSALLNNHLAQMLYTSRRLSEARAAAQRMMELDSTFTRGYVTLARIQLLRGLPDSALIALTTARRFGPRLLGFRGLRVLALAGAERWREARQLRDSIRTDPDARQSDGDLMLAALAFGDRAAALDAMERSNAAHELVTVTSYPGCDPLLDPLHGEQRFIAMMRRLGVAVCGDSAARGLAPARPR